MSWSTVLIIPDALRVKADAVGAAMGYGPQSYTLAIPSDGPTTHWGSHSWAGAEFFAMIADAQSGTLPPVDWTAHGLTPGDVLAVLSALVISAPGSPMDPEGVPYADPEAHFAAVVAALTTH